jgi:hypothetical protein
MGGVPCSGKIRPNARTRPTATHRRSMLRITEQKKVRETPSGNRHI